MSFGEASSVPFALRALVVPSLLRDVEEDCLLSFENISLTFWVSLPPPPPDPVLADVEEAVVLDESPPGVEEGVILGRRILENEEDLGLV